MSAQPAKEITAAQRDAIRSIGESLLVSAAAGSGKTTVLAERCAYLVCDADKPCDVDELLVVTFTKSAAAEMRERIRAALEARYHAEPSDRLAGQLRLLEHAQIGTIHEFCSRLLKRHFSLARMDPQFRVIDQDEASLLRRDVARELIDERYDKDKDGQFAAFVDAYAEGHDDRVIQMICRMHDMLCSVTDQKKWRSDAIKRLADAAILPLEKSELGKQLLKQVSAALKNVQQACESAIKQMNSLGGFDGYIERLTDWYVHASDWQTFFNTNGYDALVKDFGTFEAGTAKPVRKDVPNKERAKELLDETRKLIRNGELADLLAFTSDEWRAGQAAVLPHAQMLLELVEDFRVRYLRAKAALQGVDFADLEQMALELLEDKRGETSPVARRCHEDYRHVLVDEYQDVNQVQDEILRLVSTESLIDQEGWTPNLFAVGDVKQSIYRFRLAEPRRFLARAKNFRTGKLPGRVIDLQENFRSRPEVLDSVNEVFKRLMTEQAAEIEYDQSHWLRAPKDAQKKPDSPAMELHVLPRIKDGDDESEEDENIDGTEREAILCAKMIRQHRESGGEFGDVAILLRSMKFKAGQYARVLRRHDIPVHHAGGSGFFEAQEIRDMLALLSILDNQQQDIPLAALLRSPLAAIMNVENVLARVRLTYSTDAENETISFHEAIRKYANDQTDETSRLLKEMLDKLAEWRDIARRKPLADLIWHIYDQTGYLAYVSGLDDGNQRVANLLSLHQRARQFGEFLRQGLHRFMGFLNELREETDLAQPSVAGDTGRAVRILSIHAAKGLEFPVVLLPDLGKKFNMSDARGLVLTDRRMGLAMQVVDLPRQIHYPSLSSTLLVADLRKQTLAEEIRLLYVALTRAESRIVLIGTAPDGAVDKWANKFRSVKGAFPPEIVLSANSMLDWLGPMQAACGDATCKLFAYSAEQVHAWSGANKQKATDETNRLVRIAELAPLKAQVAPSFAANEIISRLEFSYPHQEFTQLAAAAAATSVGSGHFAGTSRIELQPPSSLSEQVGMSATQIGDATHKVLEHLDYLRPCDESGVREQVSQLVGRGLLTAEQANVVDVASIVWLASTPLGQLLKTHSKQLRREVAFATALGDAPISMDSVMVRGRIDLLLPMDGGVALVDYKTDRVTETGVKDRAETYLSQMGVYRDALRKIAKKEVKAIYLVFLAPRIIWKAE